MPRPNKGPYLSDRLNEHGHYEVRWTEGGRSRRRSTGTADAAQARVILAHFILGKDREEIEAKGLLLATALVDYWREHVERKVANQITAFQNVKRLAAGLCSVDVTGWTEKRSDDAIARLATHAGGPLVRDVADDDIEAYVRARGVGDGTIRRELGTLVSAINHAVRKRRLSADDRPHIPLPGEPAARDRWLTDAETRALCLAAARGNGKRLSRVYRFAMIARYMAQRKHAIETLKWEQVDLQLGTIAFNPVGRRQTKKRRPTLPIPDALLPILKQAWDEREGQGVYVLDHPGSIRTAFENAVTAAGLKDVSPHVLRHTWATRAAQNGVALWKIAGYLGDTIETVTRKYLHHCPDHLRDAANHDDPGHNAAPGRHTWPTTADNVQQEDAQTPQPA